LSSLEAVGASQVEDLSGQKPEEQGDGVWALVVSWDGHIDVLKRRVSVKRGQEWDVMVDLFMYREIAEKKKADDEDLDEGKADEAEEADDAPLKVAQGEGVDDEEEDEDGEEETWKPDGGADDDDN
jgi:hypothetical protein